MGRRKVDFFGFWLLITVNFGPWLVLSFSIWAYTIRSVCKPSHVYHEGTPRRRRLWDLEWYSIEVAQAT